MKPVSVLKFLFLLGIAATFLPLVAAAATTHEVKVGSGGLKFSPNDLTIQVGDTVHWTSAGGTHNVVADDGSFTSGSPRTNINFSKTFNSAGVILYYCEPHSSPGQNINTNMNGRITVQSGGAADLAMQSVDAQNGTYAPGDSIPIDISIKNMGDAASVGYTVTFYASTDSKCCGGSDTQIGSSNRSALAANQTSNFTGNAAFPGSIANGTYFIGATIEISDSNSANNTGVDTTPVTVAKAADSFSINNGLNDTWKNLGTPKQGFFITVFPDIVLPSRPRPVMFLAWFTYDVERPSEGVTAVLGEPGHRWLTAFGPYEGDTATLDIELTQGGIFDSGTPEPTQTPGYGSITVKFTSCNDGVVTYDIPSVGVSGTVPIIRAVPDNAVLCEAFATP